MISKILEDNKFLFTFYSRADIDQVLDRRPWTFDNNILMLQEISGEQQPRNIVLNSTNFWIRLYDLPIGALKEDIVTRLGRQVG